MGLGFVQAVGCCGHSIEKTESRCHMAVRCSCGVATTPVAIAENVPFFFIDSKEIRTGIATYTADVCADTPELSTVTFTFLDTSGMVPNRSFTFTSTVIQTVNCLSSAACLININGMGLVAGETEPRAFITSFTDSRDPFNEDRVESFLITDFGAQTQAAILETDSILALGCE
jgi:hypothetical protein